MTKWIERISRATMLGFAWAAAWIPFGVVGARIFVGEVDPEHIGGPLYAGFACGTVFAALSGFAGGRRLDEISILRAATRGALTGLLVGLIPPALGDASGEVGIPAWQFWGALVGSLSLICAVWAPVTVWFARTFNSEARPNAV